MELFQIHVPYNFLRGRVVLSWRFMLFGLDQDLLDPVASIELAVDCLEKDTETGPLLVELAGLSKFEPTRAYVEKLASLEHESGSSDIRDKWLYVVLAWILEHRDGYADPLQIVEDVYADFDYPSQIAGLVRYMPSDEVDLGSRERNEERLYEKWRAFVDGCAATHGPLRDGHSTAHPRE
ncbi:MAG: DUF2247 family protein [Polyangiaceae bacterium]